MSSQIKLVLPASAIPDNSIVTKRTGSQKYTLVTHLTIYSEAGKKQVIDGGESMKLLIPVASSKSNINSISIDTELVWSTDIETARVMLSDMIEERESK